MPLKRTFTQEQTASFKKLWYNPDRSMYQTCRDIGISESTLVRIAKENGWGDRKGLSANQGSEIHVEEVPPPSEAQPEPARKDDPLRAVAGEVFQRAMIQLQNIDDIKDADSKRLVVKRVEKIAFAVASFSKNSAGVSPSIRNAVDEALSDIGTAISQPTKYGILLKPLPLILRHRIDQLNISESSTDIVDLRSIIRSGSAGPSLWAPFGG